jgi:hypothetical protein
LTQLVDLQQCGLDVLSVEFVYKALEFVVDR